MSSRLFPYATIDGDVTLKLMDGGLDDGGWPKIPYIVDRRLVDLFDVDKASWKTARFQFEIAMPSEQVERFENCNLRVILLVECSGTLYRHAVLPVQNGNVWVGELELSRGTFRGSATVHAVVSGTVDGVAHRFLGSSESWTILFDEPAIRPLSGTIRIRWVDFSAPDDDERFLKDFENYSYFVDIQSDQPTLYLNKSDIFEGLPAILDDRPRPKIEKPLHNSQRVGIARAVWMALINTSIASIVRDEHGNPDWPAEDWKQIVLKKILPGRVFPDKGEDEVLVELSDAWSSPERAAELESRTLVVVDDLVKANKLLRETLNIIKSNSN